VATPKPTMPTAPDPAAVQAAHVAGLIGQADAAAGAKSWDAAVNLYDEVLKLDPQNQHAVDAKKRAVAQRDAAKRTFVSSRTTVQTAKAAKADFSGFESADVSVQKAPDFSGRLEFSMTPASIKAGDSYSLKIYLVNDGKKDIKVASMTVTMSVNGTGSGGPVAARVKEVAPQQRVLLEDLPGVWKDDVTAWAAEVLVTANKGDSLKAKLTWK